MRNSIIGFHHLYRLTNVLLGFQDTIGMIPSRRNQSMLLEFRNSPKPREMKKSDKLKKKKEGERKKLQRREQMEKLNAWQSRRLTRRQSK